MVDFVSAEWQNAQMVTPIGTTEWPDHPGDSGVLEAMVRPDCVEFRPEDGGNGVIDEREFRGAFYLYRVALNAGGTVRCLLSHTDEHEVGTRVSVQVRSGHLLRPFLNGLALA